MPSITRAAVRDLSESLYPLEANWQRPDQTWHQSYPDNVPPGLHYPDLRAEQLLIRAAERLPQRFAVRYFNTHWTYAELLERVQTAAGNLHRLGIRAGDRVMIVLPNCPEFVVVWFALQWLGAEVVPGNPLLSAGELAFLARKTNSRTVLGLDMRLDPVVQMTQQAPIERLLVVSLSGHLPAYLKWPYRLKCKLHKSPAAARHTQIDAVETLFERNGRPLPKPLLEDPGRPAVLQPTGGTTGTPKVAVLTHRNLAANVSQLHVWSGLKAGRETILSVLPFFHVFGLTTAMLSPIAGGATLLLQAKFDAARIWKLIDRWQPTVATLVPFMVQELCAEMRKRGNLTCLEFCMSGAAPLSGDVSAEFRRRTGVSIFEGYGLSEAAPVTHSNPPDDTARTGTIGLPLPDTEVRIVDTETGMIPLPPGEIGELIVRGPQVMAGYLDDPAETAQMLRNGWLHTGDLASMDETGFFTIVDRKKDMIISGGLNIYPTEVEQVIAEHPVVAQCAVVGVADRKYGERVVAYVVPASGKSIDFAALERHCRAHLAGYKIPRTFELCEALPTTFLGKVRRVELRSRAA